MLVGRFGFGQLAGLPVHIEVALAGTVDAVGPVQAGVEPLRRVRRHHLLGQHEAQFVVEGMSIFFRREVAALPAPVGPAACETVEHLLGGMFADEALGLGEGVEGFSVRHRAPQPRWNGFFLDLLQTRGDTRLAEVLLRQNVGSHLRPEVGDFDILQPKHHRAIRIADLACGQPKVDPGVGRLIGVGVAAFNAHGRAPSLCRRARPRRYAGDFNLRTGSSAALPFTLVPFPVRQPPAC